MAKVGVQALGQSGFRFEFGPTVVYVDPYLSDSVEAAEGPEMARRVPISTPPEDIADATWVLVSHIHLDHADPDTLVPISAASPGCRFVGPPEVIDLLETRGIAPSRVCVASESWVELSANVSVHAVPAAHTEVERDTAGNARFVGYVMEYAGTRLYHAGDTSPHEEVVSALRRLGRIDVAFLPVNECNFYRARRGIVGNMSLREAFSFAAEIDAKQVVPMHWDMFEPNAVHREEIELFYRLERPRFEMLINPRAV